MINIIKGKVQPSLTRTLTTAQGSVDLQYSHFLYSFIISSHNFEFCFFLENPSIVMKTNILGHLFVTYRCISYMSGLNSWPFLHHLSLQKEAVILTLKFSPVRYISMLYLWICDPQIYSQIFSTKLIIFSIK